VTAGSGNDCGARVAAVLALMLKHLLDFHNISLLYTNVQHIPVQEQQFVTKACRTVLNTHKTTKKIHAYYT